MACLQRTHTHKNRNPNKQMKMIENTTQTSYVNTNSDSLSTPSATDYSAELS